MSVMILTTAGRTALAESLEDEIIHLAWGSQGNDPIPWADPSNPTNFTLGDKRLNLELGRRVATDRGYAVEDPNGTIEANGLIWSISETPTNYLYLKFAFRQGDSSDGDIYQLGLFLNTVLNPDLPALRFQLNNPAGYSSGSTELVIDNLSGGTIDQLLPIDNPSFDGGRLITILGGGGTAETVRVIGVNASTNTITISPALANSQNNDVVCESPEIIATPEGQGYYLPDQVFDQGRILTGQNIAPINRNDTTREQYEFILTF